MCLSISFVNKVPPLPPPQTLKAHTGSNVRVRLFNYEFTLRFGMHWVTGVKTEAAVQGMGELVRRVTVGRELLQLVYIATGLK